MTEADLSFLDPSGRRPAPAEKHPLPPTAPAEGLVAELRAYQAALENQNKVLRYSQAVS